MFEAGLAELTGWLHARSPRLIVLEATGGLETSVAAALVEAHLLTAVINPRQARDFAKALGCLAKTDALDALVLARFGHAIQPTPRPWKGRGDPSAGGAAPAAAPGGRDVDRREESPSQRPSPSADGYPDDH